MSGPLSQMPKRIVEVAPSWPAEVFIQRHIQALQNEGISVLIATRHSNLPLSKRSSVQADVVSANIVWMPDFDKSSFPKKIIIMILHVLAGSQGRPGMTIRKRITLWFFSKLKPDLIHFHNAQLAVGLRWVSDELGIPYTVSLRGADVQDVPLRSENFRDNTILALQGASGIHTVCDAFARSPILRGSRAATTINTTVPLPTHLKEYDPDGSDGYRFLAIGRLHWRKGYPDLLIALRRVLDNGQNARLTIVGTGPDEERVRYWIDRLKLKEQVDLPGKLKFEHIRDLLQNSHAFIQSSCAEGLSNSLAEAMAFGCPVFATDVDGTNEVIHDGETGFLLQPLAPELWINQLQFISDQQRMRKVREAAHQEALNHFTEKEHACQFAEFYRQAVIDYSSREKIANHIIDDGKVGSKNFCKRNTNAPKLIVRLPWEWMYGPDLVLRSLAPLVRSEKLELIMCGKGSAKDELRYLAVLLGLNPMTVVCDDPPSYEFNLVNISDSSSQQFLVDCPNQANPTWKISFGNQCTYIGIGETSELVAVIKKYCIRINPKNGVEQTEQNV